MFGFVCNCSPKRTLRATHFGAKCSRDRVPAICVISPSITRAAAVEVSHMHLTMFLLTIFVAKLFIVKKIFADLKVG
jgi:hypothetical protein